MAEVALNATWPQALAYAKDQSSANSFGYPSGISARDLAPPEVRHMVLEHYDKFPPADPRVHHTLGMLYIFLGIASALGNYYVLKIFTKYKQLRTPSNILIVNLAFADFMIFIGLYPEMILNQFSNNGVWMFGEIACLMHSWVGTVCGLAQMITLSVIAYDRYHVIVKGMSGAPPSFRRSSQMLAYVWFFALFWGSAPLFGLGRFTLDGILSQCSYDYISTSATNRAFIIGAWFNGFFFPILTIVYCYFFIFKAVVEHEDQLREQAKKMNVKTLRSNDASTVSAEVKVAKIAMINISLWIFAWLPFAILTFVGQYDPMRITPFWGSLPVIIAKSSSVYNPIVYALSHPKYQECLRQELGWLFGGGAKKEQQQADTTSVEAASISN